MSVVVDQFLHGYSNGHRLLASSWRPDPDLAARLLSHTDAPAPAGTRLLASLPLPERDAWALTSVWAAEEITRPGSVWGHTLLLDREALVNLQGAGGLLGALRRPRPGEDLTPYRDAVSIDDISEDLDEESAMGLAPSILLATYGWPGRSTAVLMEDLEGAARVLMAIWQRQWPALRAEFRFRTRQRLGEEASGGIEVARRPSRRPVSERIDLAADGVPVSAAPPWLALLCAELTHGATPLQEFLREFGPEAPSGRSDLPALTRIEEALRSSPDIPIQAVSLLARSYPEPGQMEGLKAELLGGGRAGRGREEEARLALALRHAPALPWGRLQVARRLEALWLEGRRDAVITLLLDAMREHPGLAPELLEPLARAAEPSAIASLAETQPGLAATLLRLNPKPLGAEALWSSVEPWQRPLLKAIADAGIELPARPFLDHAGDATIAEALKLGLVDATEVAMAVSSEASDANLGRWRELLWGARKEIEAALRARVGGRWQEAALAVAAPARADRRVVVGHSASFPEHFGGMGLVVRLRVAAAIFDAAGAGTIDRAAVGKSFATLHAATGKKLLAASLGDYFPTLEDADGKIRADLRERLVELVVEEGWEAPDIAHALTDAGPGAGKVRELTPKKSELRKLMNTSWKLVVKGVDLARRLT